MSAEDGRGEGAREVSPEELQDVAQLAVAAESGVIDAPSVGSASLEIWSDVPATQSPSEVASMGFD